MINYISSLDKIWFNWTNQFAGKWQILDSIAVFFAKYFEYVLLFLLLVFLFKKFRKNFFIVFQAVLAAALARFVIVNFIRSLWFRARPFMENNVNLLIGHEKTASFPSGHASFYFALSIIVFFHNKKLGILFFVGSFLICGARVFSGVHWPTDILAGMVLGILTALIVNKFFKKLKKYFR